MSDIQREQMNVVIVGHVDHGKSTLIGRLLADTNSLPEGKLEMVKANCERNAKPFEYAFLLDALKDEQSQGITIDTARCFFKSKARDYIIIDAPGHIEFLKNMVTGAARAEAAVLVIDAHEGIRENSKRHGYMLSFLGIKNITVCVNKMDMVDYQQSVFDNIKKSFLEFLDEINIIPTNFVPISARDGENIVEQSAKMPWYQGKAVLAALDGFKKSAPKNKKYFRFPIQDIYKFTGQGDNRRIFAGRVETGTVRVGDEVVFLPSMKQSRVRSVEGFNAEQRDEAFAGQSTGFTLDTQIYIKPGEVMYKAGEHAPHVSAKFKCNIFWMGRQPFVKSKTYKMKIATQQVPVVISDILSVLDASELSSIQNKESIDRHDVAECVLETLKPIAFDDVGSISEMGRFVVVDNYEIAGGGIVLAPVFEQDSALKRHIKERESNWERSDINLIKRAHKFQHKAALVVITGPRDVGKQKIAKALEENLFQLGMSSYFLGISNHLMSATNTSNDRTLNKLHILQQLGEVSHILTDAGLVLITSISDVDEHELNMLKSLTLPTLTIVVNLGETGFSQDHIDLQLPIGVALDKAVADIVSLLKQSTLLDPDYSI